MEAPYLMDRLGIECSICLDSKPEWATINCIHLFHKICITTWVKQNNNNNTCPKCRMKISEIKPLTDTIKDSNDTPEVIGDLIHRVKEAEKSLHEKRRRIAELEEQLRQQPVENRQDPLQEKKKNPGKYEQLLPQCNEPDLLSLSRKLKWLSPFKGSLVKIHKSEMAAQGKASKIDWTEFMVFYSQSPPIKTLLEIARITEELQYLGRAIDKVEKTCIDRWANDLKGLADSIDSRLRTKLEAFIVRLGKDSSISWLTIADERDPKTKVRKLLESARNCNELFYLGKAIQAVAPGIWKRGVVGKNLRLFFDV